jgi:hypothetical protein
MTHFFYFKEKQLPPSPRITVSRSESCNCLVWADSARVTLFSFFFFQQVLVE